MVENLRTRVLFILVVVGCALYVLGKPYLTSDGRGSPFTLGLDLRGGVVLRYIMPEVADESLSDDQATEKIATTIEIYRNRLDATGLGEYSLRAVGDDQVEIGIPGITSDEADGVKQTLQSIGRLEFRIEATTGPGLNIEELYANLDAEIAARKARGETITRDTDFSNLTEGLTIEATGTQIRLVPVSEKYQQEHRKFLGIPQDKPEPDFIAIRYETREGQFFTGDQLDPSGVRPDNDGSTGLPAVGFALKPGKPSSDFGKFTQANVNKNMAIILDNQVQSNPSIRSKIPGRGVITGGENGFTPEELRRLIAVIKSGSLPLKPRLYSEQEVGPTLGQVAINRGLAAGGIAIGLVLLFMLLYYMKSGTVACLALAVNLLLLLGSLAFLNATLTLPGIAGLVLTIGMAVDANILIFERIREEAEKGKTVAQAVRNGFDKAFFTIVDANVTTFLTAFFLFKFGTGPIRGFAVTLMIGLATSMFSALYFSKTIFAWWIEKKPQSLKMMRLLAETNISFLGMRKVAYIGSISAIVIGLVLFFIQDDKKYGMDFTGGYEVQMAFQTPATQGDVLARAQSLYPNAEVITVGKVTDGKASEFQVKVKTVEEGTEAEGDPAVLFGEKIAELFRDSLVEPPIPTLSLGEETATGQTPVTFSLRYAGDVKKSDLEARLKAASSPVSNPVVTGPEQGSSFDVTAMFAQRPTSEEVARGRLSSAARLLPAASGDGDVRLSNPMPSRSFIGPRAGTELRDAAIRAIFFSLVGIILYIRLRFRQYRYGFAACLALVHDVLFTLGVIGLIRLTGLVDIEIDLAIIAAFLTIIGYSLNDTIVIFDRVRENLPRLDKDLPTVLDRSLNQTLSRTILTSLTTLISVLLLFAFNVGQRNVLEGFAFSLMIGVVVGTYSTIFVASPAVVFLTDWIEKRKQQSDAARAVTKA